MEEALEAVDVVADAGLEGALVWALRLLGLLVLVAGLGLWLLTEMGLLVLPAVLIVVGLLLIAVPGLLVELVEIAG